MKRLGEFEQLLLFALVHLEENAWGRTIRELVLERTGREVSPGALYTTLDRLEDQGLVASFLGEGTPARGGRRRRHYRLTPAGQEALAKSWRTVWAMAEGVRDRLEPEPDEGAPEGVP